MLKNAKKLNTKKVYKMGVRESFKYLLGYSSCLE